MEYVTRLTKMILKLKEKADIQLFQSSGDAQAMKKAQQNANDQNDDCI